MDREHFAGQIDRLKGVYGERVYPDERIKILFNTLKSMPDWWLEEVVTKFIAHNRTAPMLNEFQQEMNQFDSRKAYSRPAGPERGLFDILDDAAKKSKTTDRDFVKACAKLLRDKVDGKLKGEQFLQGCEYLEETAKLIRRDG